MREEVGWGKVHDADDAGLWRPHEGHEAGDWHVAKSYGMVGSRPQPRSAHIEFPSCLTCLSAYSVSDTVIWPWTNKA